MAHALLSRNPAPSSEGVRSRMRLQRSRDTACEVRVRGLLWKMGLRYRVDFQLEPTLRRRADIVFRGAKVAVFIDGCFWHRCPKHGRLPRANRAWWKAKLLTTLARDLDTTRRLREAGWEVLRFWEHEAPGRVAARVFKAVRARRGGVPA